MELPINSRCLPLPLRGGRGAATLTAILLAVSSLPTLAQEKEKTVVPLPTQVESVLQAMSAQPKEAKTFTVHAES